MAAKKRPNWPVLKQYDENHLARIALPLGGIGTGTVSLGGRGDLRDWEIVNRPAKGFTPGVGGIGNRPPFFALWARPAGRPAVARALEGPLDDGLFEGQMGSPAANHGLPRFRRCTFEAAYPFGQVLLSDPEVPLRARIEAFNPLVPGDPDASGIPVAVLRFVLSNPGRTAVSASICGTVPNFIGADGSKADRDWKGDPSVTGPKANRNEYRAGRGVRGIFMSSEGVPIDAEQWGTLALTTTARAGLSWRTAWAKLSWGDSLLDFWDDFIADGRIEDRDAEGADSPAASLAVSLQVPPKATREVTFLLTWHFPNRQTWTPKKPEESAPAASSSSECSSGCGCVTKKNPNWIGNYYATQYADAWDAAEKTAAALPRLEARTIAFVDAFCSSDLPEVVKEAALFNISTLRTQTCFRTPDGRFFGWEGCCDRNGCCMGSCTHVWNYEQATAFLFGPLARSMREVEFAFATRDDGLMCFRTHLPLDRATESGKAAADGQMGCIMKVYRDWQLSGDRAFLERLWPKVRKALAFCWVEGGWDADRDGVMEGCQHNTMDVEYYGPNPQMTGWYLGALRAGEEMARALGDAAFADECRRLFESGSKWMDENLFNGDYYEHQIRPPKDGQPVYEGLRIGMSPLTDEGPVLQLGSGCLIDQLVGQYMAHVCGLGYLHGRPKVRKTLKSILRYNFRSDFHGHFNHLRSFVLGDESALLMASYPKGRRPKRPFPYFNEVMTGFEYTAAVHMLYEGMTAEGLRCISAIRARYDGRRRSPFNEAECGHHYARAMASWAAVLALTGFAWSGVEGRMSFAAVAGAARKVGARAFWSTGDAWGTFEQKAAPGGVRVRLAVLGGRLKLRRLVLTGLGEADLGRLKALREGEEIEALVKRHG